MSLLSFKDLLRALPKVEVHNHLGGSARVTTVEELLRKNPTIADPTTRAQAMVIPMGPRYAPHHPPDDQYEGFRIISEANQNDPQNTRRMVKEYFEDCVADGIPYVELRTGGDHIESVRVVLSAMQEFQHSNPNFECQLILSMKRDKPASSASTTVDNAITLKQEGFPIAGLDFCGVDTSHLFTNEFAQCVARARDHGIPFVPHFAEKVGEQDLHEILDCQPARLGHCLYTSTDVFDRVRNAKIPIECCFAGNLATMYRDKKLDERLPPDTENVGLAHPAVTTWYRTKQPFLLCCDDIGLLPQYTLSVNYQICAEAIVEGWMREQGKWSTTVKDDDETFYKLCGRVAWSMAYNAVNFIFASDDKKEVIRKSLLSHPWAPNNEICAEIYYL
eukprot:PhF_6_TR36009/c0_g1_i3/m.52189